ncbi:MAG: hypothetical protein NUV31_00235 [Dehalococcoidales bacterium]|jgi:hypothetical protein|nr:hypothetical protein [Dehalococcoidales bacterium]
MKTGIIIGILAGIITVILVVLVVVFNLILPLNRQIASSGESAIPNTIISDNQTAVITPKQTISASDNLVSPTLNSPVPSSSSASDVADKDVNFILDITSGEVIGLNAAKVEARLTNSGTYTAHHTTATIEIIYQNRKILINGQESLLVNIGDLAPGESRQLQLKAEVGLSDALKIKQAGATVRLTITSDERQQVFTYDYVP